MFLRFMTQCLRKLITIANSNERYYLLINFKSSFSMDYSVVATVNGRLLAFTCTNSFLFSNDYAEAYTHHIMCREDGLW